MSAGTDRLQLADADAQLAETSRDILGPLLDTDDIAAHAECNPGTLKVIDVIADKVVWERPLQ